MENGSVDSSDVVRFSGRLKWFDRQRGYGFVVIDDSDEEILIHSSIIKNFGQGSIADGSILQLGAKRTSRGMRAVELFEVATSSGQGHLIEHKRDGNSDRTDFFAARVKWFDEQKGFGFVNVFGEPEDCFLHVRVVRAAGLDIVEDGEAIGVRLDKSDRGVFVSEVGKWIDS